MKGIKKISQSQLFKITSLNSLSMLLKIGIGLVTSKLLAVFVGPSGIALVGNLRNFMNSLENVATLGFQNGIVKYTAEIKDDKTELERFVTTIFISLLVVALVLSGGLFFLAPFFANQLLRSENDYTFIIKSLALAVPWYAVSIVLLSLLNGLGKFKKVIWINILGNVISLIVAIFLILKYQTLGALLAIVIAPAVLLFVVFYIFSAEMAFFKKITIRDFDFSYLKKLSSYSVMALVSTVLGPLVLLSIRTNIIETLGIDQAGFWETITRISSYYMLFVSTILTVYFLPKLASARDSQETKAIFWSYYKGILPIFIIGLIGIYLARFLIIKILFTQAFLEVESLFFWQLLGDVFKAAALVLGYQFFARKLTIAFVVSELFSLALFYFLSDYLIGLFGIQGVVMAQAIDNMVYLLVLILYFRKSLFNI
ncbi:MULTISPECIES: O-antigen translocase [unclassified Flavobacterium]|uniref:O-antigen translocase n=1 Tax=unclassified Flavobacterium TaxID=196869 RepID=UPI001CE40788|nr:MULTISPECIES: O-antigen translocase [unclassified Flavobacterium]